MFLYPAVFAGWLASMKQYIDLHTHSTASDGSCSPTELMRLAAREGVRVLALTDHDTTAGLDEAEAEAGLHNIEFIRGCEVSSVTEYGHADFLGLWVPRGDAVFEAKLAWLREERARRNAAMLAKLENLGFPLRFAPEEIPNLKTLGRAQIALRLLRQGYVKSVQEAFDRYIGHGRPAYVPKESYTPEQAVRFLDEAGAVTVFAHPMLLRIPPGRLDWLEDLVRRLVPCGLDALEIYHSEHSDSAVRHLVTLADKYGLLPCGGSDFHGAPKPAIRLGRGRGGFRVPENVVENLKARWREKQAARHGRAVAS